MDLEKGDIVVNLMGCTGFEVGEKVTIENIHYYECGDYKFTISNSRFMGQLTLSENEVDYFFSKEGEEYKKNIVRKIDEQMEKGYEKYGNFLSHYDNMPVDERIEHIQDELIDALFYSEHIRKNQKKLEKENEELRGELKTLREKLDNE